MQRTWLTLEELKVPYQYIEINPYHKSPEFLALNPRGLVPALGVPVKVSGDGHRELKPLYESNIINEYLDATYADPSTSLYPIDNYERARMKIWIDWIGGKVCPAFYRLLQHTSESSYTLEEAREQLLQAIVTWTQEADPEGPFWNGKEVSMIDLTLAPWNERLFLIEHYKSGGTGFPFYGNHGSKQPSGGHDNDKVIQRWLKWSKAMSERQSVQDTLSEREMYLKSYQRYAENTTGSEVGQATRAGKALP